MEELQNLIKFLKTKGLKDQKIPLDVWVGIIEYFTSKQETKQCDIPVVSHCADELEPITAKNSNELYTLLPTVFYELEETEENKLTITEMEDEQIHIALEDWDDFASMDMTKKEAIKMAQTIIKHCM